MELLGEFKNLTFTRGQLFLSPEEAVLVAEEFWGNGNTIPAGEMTDRDRAFLQVALLIAIDRSEKAGLLFDIFSSFVRAAPSSSIKTLVKELAKRTAKRWFASIIDDDPKISAVGKSAVQYSAFTTQWRLRRGSRDPTELTNFLSD